MGQYYNAVIVRGNNKTVYPTHVKPNDKTDLSKFNDWEREQIKKTGSYYMCCKLLEHGYWGNPYTDGVATELLTPGRIAWVGDYVEQNELPDTFGEDDYEEFIVTEPENEDFLKGKYLINHTKKEYISCDEFKEANKWQEKYTDMDGKNHEYTMCYHPLALLTAAGNGRGGGDYYGKNKESIGVWKFDEISVSDIEPTDFQKKQFVFEPDM